VGAHDKMDLAQTRVGAVIGVWFANYIHCEGGKWRVPYWFIVVVSLEHQVRHVRA